MKLYTCYTKTHSVLMDLFLKTLPKDIEIDVYKLPQISENGDWGSPEFNQTTILKMLIWKQAIQENWGNTFMWADSDCVFLKDTISHLAIKELGDADIACQEDHGNLCTGLCVIRANQSVLNLINKTINLNNGENDQERLNKVKDDVKWKFLSHTWHNKSHSFIDKKDIIVYHANYIVGVKDKLIAMQNYLLSP